MFLTTAVLAALCAQASAQLLAGSNLLPADFAFNDQCAALQLAPDAVCANQLVTDQLVALDQFAVDGAQEELDLLEADFSARKDQAERGLQAAINALNRDPNSKALINWCKGEVRKIGDAAKVPAGPRDRCVNICGQVKKGRDASEAFTCIEDEINKRVIELQSDFDNNQVGFFAALDAQVSQGAFFQSTLEDADEAIFETQLFGDARKALELEQAQEETRVLAIAEARGNLEEDANVGDDIVLFSQAFLEQTAFQDEFVEGKADTLQLAEELNFEALFAAAATGNPDADPRAMVFDVEFEADQEAEIDTRCVIPLEQAFGAAAVFQIVESGFDRKRQTAVTGRIAFAADTDEEQFARELQLARICIDNDLQCTPADIVSQNELDEALIEDDLESSEIEGEGEAEAESDDDVVDKGKTDPWKKESEDPWKKESESNGYGKNEKSVKRDSDSDDDDEDGAASLALGVTAIAVAFIARI